MKKEKTKGLGDKVEEIIDKVAPSISKKAKQKGCNSCQNRKIWLNNNFNAKFG